MDALVEIHTIDEGEKALESGATIIGVNNRDLKTMATDLATSESIIPTLGSGLDVVSESGMAQYIDVTRVAAAKARSVLIGTAFCLAPDPESKVRAVMGW